MATSDGTVVTRPGAVLGEGRWDDSLVVLETYGGTPLQDGDEILQIEGAGVSEMVSGADASERRRGDVLRYQVRRQVGELDVNQQVEVPLTRYAVGDALLENPQVAVASLALLVAGTFLLLRNASPVAAGATLLAGASAGVALTAQPFGVQALEVAGAGGLWPHVVGELAVGLALGALLVAVCAFPRPPGVLAAPRSWLPVVVPFAAWACWLAGYAARQPAPARLQAQLDVTGVGGRRRGRPRCAGRGHRRPSRRLRRPAGGPPAAGLGAAHGGRDPAGPGRRPIALQGSPLVAREVLALVLVPVVLACWVAAVLGYRLVEIDATLRRSLVQLVLAALVGAVFLAAANAVNLAAGTSVRSMVTGGVVALVLLPAALLLRRTASRLVYGDRAFPYRVVSELRRVEPTTAPENVLDEMLTTLSRSLRLDYARIESTGSAPEDRFARRAR